MCILGANGVGKTTMYRTILGFLPLLGGEIYVDGESIQTISREELARRIAYVPQYHTPPFPYSVFDVVLREGAPMFPGFLLLVKRMRILLFRCLTVWGFYI